MCPLHALPRVFVRMRFNNTISHILTQSSTPDSHTINRLSRFSSLQVCIAFLKNLTLREFTSRVVKGGDKIDLGGGHELEFVMAPNLHWPDTMFSYDPLTGIMFTCDAFGMHYCSEDPMDTDLEVIVPHFRFYYDCLMGPNARSVLTALRKVKDIEYRMIATGHGPVLRWDSVNHLQDMFASVKTGTDFVSTTPTAVSKRINIACPVMDCGGHWYWGSDRLVLARFDAEVSVFCNQSKCHPSLPLYSVLDRAIFVCPFLMPLSQAQSSLIGFSCINCCFH